MEPTGTDGRVPAHREPGEGCLTVVVRIPVRIVVLVLVVPVRLLWDALTVCAKAVERTALRPVGRALAWSWRRLVVAPAGWIRRYLVVAPLAWLVRYLVVVPARWWYGWVLAPVGRGFAWLARGVGVALVGLGRALFVWPWVALWRYVLAPVGRGIGLALAWLVRYLVVVPARWWYGWVLAPVGRGFAWLARGVGVALVWLGKALFVWPWVALYAYVLTPLGRAAALLARGVAAAVAALVRWTVVVPALALWRFVLRPAGRALAAAVTVVGREISDALGHCWRAAGFVSRAVGRLLRTVLRWTFVEPARWMYRTLLTPLGHGIRDGIWRPVRSALGSAGRATRAALSAARHHARQTRQEIRRALFGAPGERAPGPAVPPRREPARSEARTLGKTSGRD
ncbi:hypothetical protein [Streptomyces sp. NPDC048638]|uniref:hypothetical protein n=1 Tax=Streptomyces sp. NPDC048638 TaxID=3365580 RepID=UPI00371CF28B